MAVPYTFGSATASIPLSQLDSNFATAITLGNTAVQLGNTITTLTGVTNVASGTSLTLGSNGNTTAITIDTSQNVGIGTAGGTYGLDLSRSTTNGSTIRIYNSTASSSFLLQNDTAGNAYVQQQFNGPLIFATNNSERMRIHAGGEISQGNTSTSNPPSQGLLLLGQQTNSQLAVGHATGTGSGQYYAVFGYNGTTIGGVTQNGTTGVLYNLTSDYRLKNDQQHLTGAKDFIMALQPKKWQWWDGSGEGVGFVAHEFMEVAKHSGQGEKDGVETIEIKDADGNVTGTEQRPVYQSIQPSSSEVMANLVAFIQEQQALIQSLTDRITAQDADIAALKAKVGI